MSNRAEEERYEREQQYQRNRESMVFETQRMADALHRIAHALETIASALRQK